jgi:hypothetical protein
MHLLGERVGDHRRGGGILALDGVVLLRVGVVLLGVVHVGRHHSLRGESSQSSITTFIHPSCRK